jgi:cyclase
MGADELVFLDITATNEKRKTLSELVTRISKHINIPFTVGGGISSEEDVSVLLNCGADKISVNTAAVKRPELIRELAGRFRSQRVVLATTQRIDSECNFPQWRRFYRIKTLEWPGSFALRRRNPVTTMDHDGTKMLWNRHHSRYRKRGMFRYRQRSAGTMELSRRFRGRKADAA